MLKLLILAALAATASAHESCCAKKARLAKLRTIPDPNAEPPAVDAAGEPRLVANTSVAKPAGWDDEDDGPWAPPLIDNPRFRWTAPMVDNPDYDPPTFLAELQSEVEKAAPWVVLGSAITASLELAQLPLHSLGALLGGAGPVGAALVGLATPLCSCGRFFGVSFSSSSRAPTAPIVMVPSGLRAPTKTHLAELGTARSTRLVASV